jgi:predicted Fe-Mo cluster-binding NifX family protein
LGVNRAKPGKQEGENRMKVAVSSTGKNLDSAIDPRFGRCSWFLIIETGDMSFEVFSNESVALGGGAGIQSAQFIASKGATMLLTGNCGPNAMSALSAAGVKVILGQTGTVREAVERCKKGELPSASEPNVGAHYGMGGGGGMGRGMGRGMGMGGGMGRGMRTAEAGLSSPSNAGSLSKADEIRLLKDEAQDLIRKMKEIEQRIGNLERGG